MRIYILTINQIAISRILKFIIRGFKSAKSIIRVNCMKHMKHMNHNIQVLKVRDIYK